jgi:predicted ArsR family transcriptional regulator
MPKGTDNSIKTACATAIKKGEAFTVKELGLPYSTVKRLIEGGFVKEKAIIEKAGRGRNPKTYALTAKGKKAAA